MGWLTMPSLEGHRTPRDYLDAEFTSHKPEMTTTILRSSLVRMRTYYAALEILRPVQPLEVTAIVCLVRYNPRDRDGLIFGYKDMDETMGPHEAECPTPILDLLTPTTNEYALRWREACWAFAAKRSSRPKLRNGDTTTLDRGMSFTDGPVRRSGRARPW